MTQRDILVLAPYNLQRIRIKELLEGQRHGGVRVGIVNKLRGQQRRWYSIRWRRAATRTFRVRCSFCSFAIGLTWGSRGRQSMSVLVRSPALLDARCNRVEEIELVSLLYGFGEAAGWVQTEERRTSAI